MRTRHVKCPKIIFLKVPSKNAHKNDRQKCLKMPTNMSGAS